MLRSAGQNDGPRGPGGEGGESKPLRVRQGIGLSAQSLIRQHPGGVRRIQSLCAFCCPQLSGLELADLKDWLTRAERLNP